MVAPWARCIEFLTNKGGTVSVRIQGSMGVPPWLRLWSVLMSQRLLLIGTLVLFLLEQWGWSCEKAGISLSWPKVKETVLLKVCKHRWARCCSLASAGSLQKLSYNHISNFIWEKRAFILGTQFVQIHSLFFCDVMTITEKNGIQFF